VKLVRIFSGIVVVIVAVLLAVNWFESRREERNLLKWIKVTVAEVDRSIPPGLLVDVENGGPNVVGKMHFRLVFEVEGRSICRVDADYGDFEPGQKRRLFLKCQNAVTDAGGLSFKKARYRLQVFPEYKRGLEMMEGEFILK
jgi:hypothetical protein